MLERKSIAMVLAEALGTAMLTFGILAITKSAIGIPYFVALGAGLALAVITMLFMGASGAHVNPAITLGLWTVRKIDTAKALVYIVAQFVGAVAAWQLFVYFTDRDLQNIAGASFNWRVLVAEGVGTMILAMGIAAVSFGKDQLGKQAAIIGGAFALGILAAGVVSNGLLNPAVALGVQSWSKAYVIGPILGSLVGFNLYALVFAPAGSLKLASVVKPKSTTRKKK